MANAKIWSKSGAHERVGLSGEKRKGLSNADIENMKKMSGEEQLKVLQNAFNFYAMDDPNPDNH